MGNTALVTGASRGIGRAIALELCRQGYHIAIHYLRSRECAEQLQAELTAMGCRNICVQGDVSSEDDCQRVADTVRSELGNVSLLVNNAGVSKWGLFQDVDTAAWNRLLSVNLTGVRNMTMAVLPEMLHRKAGVIINIASIWGLRGGSCETSYAVSKAAVVGLTRSLALELAPSGIRVNAVAPGCIDTDMLSELGADTKALLSEQTPLGRLGTPEDIAYAVSFLSSERASFITGQTLTVDGGFTV